VVQRVWAESSRDNLSVIAAGCAFYALFAIFPTLSALISFYGLTADPATIELQFSMLALVLPPQAYHMLVEQTHHIAEASGSILGWSFVVSVGLALWSVTALTRAIFSALNIAYEEHERRSLLRFYLSAFIFTVAGIIGGVVTLLAVVYVPIAFAYVGYTTDFERFISWARWPLLALMALLLLTCLYRYGPSWHLGQRSRPCTSKLQGCAQLCRWVASPIFGWANPVSASSLCGHGRELRIDFDDGRLQSRQSLIRVFLRKAFLWDDGDSRHVERAPRRVQRFDLALQFSASSFQDFNLVIII
jgi:hypothetical protein